MVGFFFAALRLIRISLEIPEFTRWSFRSLPYRDIFKSYLWQAGMIRGCRWGWRKRRMTAGEIGFILNVFGLFFMIFLFILAIVFSGNSGDS